jgi:zinc transporter ZupT
VTLDRLAVVRAAAVGVLLAVPAAFANVVLADQEDRSAVLSLVTLVVLVLGFLAAGFAAGRFAAADAARHGTAAALVVLVLVQVIAVLGRLDRGDGVSIAAIVFTGFLAAVAGATGGTLASRRRTPGPTHP